MLSAVFLVSWVGIISALRMSYLVFVMIGRSGLCIETAEEKETQRSRRAGVAENKSSKYEVHVQAN
jgi:hypothetical protein